MSGRSVSVSTFDFGAYLLDATARAGDGPVLLKFDVEGAEYKLRPGL